VVLKTDVQKDPITGITDDRSCANCIVTRRHNVAAVHPRVSLRGAQQNYGDGTQYLQPLTILNPRFARFNVTFDF